MRSRLSNFRECLKKALLGCIVKDCFRVNQKIYKLQEILLEARERLERRKTLPSGDVIRQIEYFIEPKDEDEE